MSALVNESSNPNTLTTELWYVAGTGDLNRLNELLNQNVDVNAGDRTGVTALMRAAYHGQLPVVLALLDRGADPNVADRGGLSALQMAKHAGHAEIIDALLSFGAKGKPARSKPSLVTATDESPSEPLNVEAENKSKVRTLHDPPEIWQMVHATGEFDSSPSASRFNFSRALMVVAAIIVFAAAGVFGFWYLRAARNDQAARQRNEILNQPTAAQPAVAEQPKSNELKPINPPSQNPSTNEQTIQGSTRNTDAGAESTSAPLARKPLPKTRNVTKTSTPVFPEKADSVFNNKAGSARNAAKPESSPAAKSAEIKKDAGKTPTQDPAKSSVTKPKVIPWP